MDKDNINFGKRFSGADWADIQKDIMIVGIGGIGSWLTLNLSRIGHSLFIVDGDTVDETNVEGGQLFRRDQIGWNKPEAIKQVCRQFGCTNSINNINYNFERGTGVYPIVIAGVDNMKTRRDIFEEWKSSSFNDRDEMLLIDGRLTMEMYEVFAMRGTDANTLKYYEDNYLFSDDEANLLDCTTKQSTFAAMAISSAMTATLCNFISNQKLGVEMRDVPFYERMYFPMKLLTLENAPIIEEAIIETEKLKIDSV